jgi:protein SCO1/2
MSNVGNTHRTGARWFNIIAMAVASIALVIVAFFAGQYYFGAPKTSGVASDTAAPLIGGPFTLTDQHGDAVTDADFRGRYMLVYFGFTYCPDVCPTALTTITEAMNRLGDAADKIVPILITVDPERDTPEQLKMYADHFSPRLVALTGTPEQIADVARKYRIYYAKAADQDADDDAYTMDHSAITYLMGPDGRYVRHFSHVTSAERMTEQLREIVVPAS